MSPLIGAITNCGYDVVKMAEYLINAGANFTQKTYQGASAYDRVQAEAYEYYHHGTMGPIPFRVQIFNIMNNRLKTVQTAPQQQPTAQCLPTGAASHQTTTAAHFGAGASSAEIKVVQAAKQKQQELDAALKTRKLNLEFVAAAKAEEYEKMTTLLTQGADINARDTEGFTALMYASLHGDYFKILLLINKEANPVLKNKDGKTARDLAPDGMKTILKTCEDKWSALKTQMPKKP